MFADDTILASTDKHTIQKYIAAVEKESSKYGMKLNKGKCEALLIAG